MTDFRISVASPPIPIYSDIDKIQKGGIGKTMAARGLVNGRGQLRRSRRDLVFPMPPF